MHRVVVVEDEELISTMIRLNLEQEGFDVTAFADAESMLEYLGRNPGACDVLLLDIMLPGMHGDAAVTELRRQGLRAPILMLTAKRDIDSRVNALNSGADDYLTKPFNIEELIARVNALLRRCAPDNNPEPDRSA